MIRELSEEQFFLSWWMKRKFNKLMLPWSRGHDKITINLWQVVFKTLLK